MSKNKTIIVLGGTGFVGRAIVEKYSKNNWQIIIPTRSQTINDAKNKITLHNFNKNLIETKISNKSIIFLLNVDLANEKWVNIQNWLTILKESNVNTSSILRIINLSGETSTNKKEIFRSNLVSLKSIFTLISFLKSKNRKVTFTNLGSTAERNNNRKLSPYESTKNTSRKLINESQLCDYHFITGYIKGKGEQKMSKVAPTLWNKLKYSNRWLFGFKVSIIDVDDLANMIFYLVEIIRYNPIYKPVEVNATNGEIIFGEMIKNLLPKNERIVPKMIIPKILETLFLKTYFKIILLVKPNNQFSCRLANFAERSLNSKNKEKRTHMKTVKEIKRLVDNNEYKIIETKPYLIISNIKETILYILKEKNKKQLIEIIQKSIIF